MLRGYALPRLETYLALHGDLRHSPRIRYVTDYLHEALRAYANG